MPCSNSVFALALVALLSLAFPVTAGDYDNSRSYAGPGAGVGPDWVPPDGRRMPAGSKKEVPPLTVSAATLSAEAKMKMMQSVLMGNPMSLRDMINMMVAKKKVAAGVSFDEVIQSMDLRANLLNMMKVGHNTPWKVIEAATGQPTERLEMLSYCDVPTMKEIIDFVPEFASFVPCRITVMEDAEGAIWIMTLDWDVRWLDTSPNPNRISPELREHAIKVRENIESIMEAGANGDL